MEEISYAGSRNSGKKRLSKRLLIFGSLFLLVLLLLGSAIYFITSEGNSSESEETNPTTESISLPAENEEAEEISPTQEPSLTPESTTTPSKSPSAAPTAASSSKSGVRITVQNGSGVTGAAGDAADVLRTAGYTISSTGNADSTNYADVTIQIKNSKKSNLAEIEKTLSKEYSVGETSTDLPESTSYDVLVIVGK